MTLYFSYLWQLWGGHPWADSHKIWHACCSRNVIKISDFLRKFSRVSDLQAVKIPVFSLTLLVIVTTVLRYRAACDRTSKILEN